MRGKKLAAVAAGAAIAAITIPFVLYLSRPVMPRPIITLTTHFAQHASDFFARNPHIDPGPNVRSEASGKYYMDWGLLAFVAHASRTDEPDGYILRYKNGDCEVILPAGRAVSFSHHAGFFNSLTSTLPLEPLPYDKMMALAQEIAASFDKAGWKRRKYDESIRQETFGSRSGGSKLEILGQWVLCSDESLYVEILLKNLNSLPTAPMVPLVPGRRLPDDFPDRYIIQVDFGSKGLDLDNEMVALRDARRIAVHGDEDKTLTLKDWLDDPNWRPPGWNGKFIK
jgi:hypothetical protein